MKTELGKLSEDLMTIQREPMSHSGECGQGHCDSNCMINAQIDQHNFAVGAIQYIVMNLEKYMDLTMIPETTVTMSVEDKFNADCG
jgi:hypothetical protein